MVSAAGRSRIRAPRAYGAPRASRCREMLRCAANAARKWRQRHTPIMLARSFSSLSSRLSSPLRQYYIHDAAAIPWRRAPVRLSRQLYGLSFFRRLSFCLRDCQREHSRYPSRERQEEGAGSRNPGADSGGRRARPRALRRYIPACESMSRQAGMGAGTVARL